MSYKLDRNTGNGLDNLYIQIVDLIKDWIKTGKYKPDDKLPSERELAELFGVSRVPVREALKILEYLGCIRKVRGGGFYVSEIDVASYLNNLDIVFGASPTIIEELFETREAIETYAVSLAATRRDDFDLLQIQSAVDEMRHAIDLKIDVVKSSTNFHNSVIRATHNDVIISIYGVLSNLLTLSKNQSLQRYEHQKEALKFHQMITDAIKAGDAELAATYSKAHLKQAKEMLLEQLV